TTSFPTRTRTPTPTPALTIAPSIHQPIPAARARSRTNPANFPVNLWPNISQTLYTKTLGRLPPACDFAASVGAGPCPVPHSLVPHSSTPPRAKIMKSIVLAPLGMLVSAVPAWAVAPTVRLIQPVGGQRGTEVTVTLTGQRLADIQEILFYQPGITVTK